MRDIYHCVNSDSVLVGFYQSMDHYVGIFVCSRCKVLGRQSFVAGNGIFWRSPSYGDPLKVVSPKDTAWTFPGTKL